VICTASLWAGRIAGWTGRDLLCNSVQRRLVLVLALHCLHTVGADSWFGPEWTSQSPYNLPPYNLPKVRCLLPKWSPERS